MFVIMMVQTPSQRGRIQLALKTLIYHARKNGFIDPKDDMFVIMMVQTASQRGRIQLALKTRTRDGMHSMQFCSPRN
jgi:hypothetical protein